MNLSSNHNLNSSQVKVSSRFGVSCFWDIHHFHACSFNRVWVKWICSLLVSKCYVSIYASIWCNHGHTRLVLVSFLMKGSSSFALIIALAEPPLGALLMAPNPFTMWFINLVVSWFYVVAFFCWTTNTQKECTRAKNSLDDFSTFEFSSSYFSRDLSTIQHFRYYLPHFSLLGPSKGVIKKFTSPFDSK